MLHPAIARFLDQHGRDGADALVPDRLTHRTVARAAALLRKAEEGKPTQPRSRITLDFWDEQVEGGPAVRIYRGPGRPPQHSVLFLHGGGWVTGGLQTQDHTCRRLALAGLTVVSVDYRLAPEHPAPAAINDCAMTLAWMIREAARLRIIATKGVAVVGCSAGGNLAASVALRSRDDPALLVAMQVLVYPALDPAMQSPSHREFGAGFHLTTRQIRFFWHAYAGECLDDPQVAPAVCQDVRGAPPALVLTAECDPLRDEAERFAERLAASGVAVAQHRYAGMIHGFLRLHDLVTLADDAVDDIARAVLARYETDDGSNHSVVDEP